MTFCSYCGAELTEGTAFCPNCGAGQVSSLDPLEQTAVTPEAEVFTPEQSCPSPVYQDPIYQAPVYSTPAEPATLPTSAKVLGLISMICGLVSLISCYVGFLYSIPALILSGIASSKAPNVPNGMAKAGKITGIIGIVMSVVCFIAYIVLMSTGTAFVTEHMYDF